MDSDEPAPDEPGARHARSATDGRLTRLARRPLHAYLVAVAWVRHPRNRLPVANFILGLIAASVVGLLTFGGSDRRSTALPPTPPSPSATATFSPGRSTPTPGKSTVPAKPIHCSTPAPSGGGSAPFRICIPVLRVDASMMQLGLNKDRTVEVPPLSRVGDAGWYKYSAQPGAVGPTVILGHVDSAQYGAGVFYRLGQLHIGDNVVVSRGDGKIATFQVDRVAEVSKSRFPTDAVYGATSGPALRLVTCGGRFDAASGNYLDNIIVYGTLQSLRNR